MKRTGSLCLKTSHLSKNNKTEVLPTAAEEGNNLPIPHTPESDLEQITLIAALLEAGKISTCLAVLATIEKICELRTPSTGSSILHKAAKNNQIEVITYLLERGCDINDTDSIHATPLHYAASAGCVKACGTLLSNGGNIHAKDIYEHCPFYVAVKQGHLEVVNTLLMFGADVNTRAAKGNTALFFACEQGNEKMVRFLLEKGACVARVNRMNETCISQVLNYPTLLSLLLKELHAKGAATEHRILTQPDDVGQNIAHKCVKYNYITGLVTILHDCGPLTAVTLLTEPDKLKCSTPLHLAVLNLRLEMLKLILMNHDVNIDVQNYDGNTAMHLAIGLKPSPEQTQIIEFLAAHEAKLNVKNKQGTTASKLAKKQHILLPHIPNVWDKLKHHILHKVMSQHNVILRSVQYK